MAVLRLLVLVAVSTQLSYAQLGSQAENADNSGTKIVQPRAIESSDDETQQSGGKFSLYVGTINGVRREIFNEVEGEGMHEPDNQPNPADPWGAYDDNTIIETEAEKNLFVPKPYRPSSKEKTTTTTQSPSTQPPTTIRTIPFVQTTAAPRQPVTPVVHQPSFGRQELPQTPPRLFVPSTRPPQPFTPQPQFPDQQSRPALPPQPPQTFRPRTRRPPFQPPTPSPFQQPHAPQRPFQQFRPQPTPPQAPPTTQAPQLPFATQQNLRTGVCPLSIFYISTPINGPTRLSFTHFAIAVTVDQCARTCHEFNCAIAHYNPSNGHCEFNPSTAFAIRNGQCPAWPSLHYRNNVVASEPVRIFCVTCQRPRRRQNRPRTSLNSRTPVIHGVLVRQPKAVALGVSQFSLGSSADSKREVVGVSPIQFEDGGDEQLEPQTRSHGRNRAYGASINVRSNERELRSLEQQ
ncbi:unnamed protein product [Cylicocyclus nassatus]|uniref:Uncharacterized protein n=1 Tax=Cylicocyclus nassatus TaxID=53992 RepID=A0AA36MDX4_CYLNA|nr:unnamed protein product [Cylicocyclus nassatus]